MIMYSVFCVRAEVNKKKPATRNVNKTIELIRN